MEKRAEPLPAFWWEHGRPAAQLQAASLSHCLGLGSSFSHTDSETLRFLWLVVSCQFRDLRWPSK